MYTARLAVLTLLAITLVFAHEHSQYCDHDAEIARTQEIDAKHGRSVDRRVVDVGRLARRDQQATWGPFRLQFATDYIYNDIETRTCYSSTGTYTTVCGTNMYCTANCDASKQVTNDLVASVVNQLLPDLTATLSQLVQVRQLVKATYASNAKCNNGQGGVPVPQNIIANGQTSDLLIILTARPSINAQAIATTSICFSETSYGRPILAQINLDPKLFLRGETYVEQKGTLLHEITHAMGFSADKFNSFVDQSTGAKLTTSATTSVQKSYVDSTGTTYSQTISYLITPKLINTMKSHFGCSSLPSSQVPGVELEEFGSSGTAGSHFEKRVYFNELMAGSPNGGLAGVSWAVSPFTLAFYEDSGWYISNYSAVVSGSTPLVWGKNTGCSMPTQRCEDWNLGSLTKSYYCSSNVYSSDNQFQCTYNLRAKGSCILASYNGNLQYYEHIKSSPRLGGTDSLMDYCPFVFSFTNGDCTNTANSGIGKGFEYFGTGSACWDSNIAPTLDTSQKSSDARCLQYNCKTDTTVLQVKVGSNWIDCPADQSASKITPNIPGYTGYIMCPSRGYDTLCVFSSGSGSGGSATPSPTKKCDNFLGLFCNSAVQAQVGWILVISFIALLI